MKEFKYDSRIWIVSVLVTYLVLSIGFFIHPTTKGLKLFLEVTIIMTIIGAFIYIGFKFWGPDITIDQDFLKIGHRKITADAIRGVEIKNFFLARSKSDGLESLRSNPEPNIYGARISFLKPLGDKRIISFDDYYNYPQLIEELEQFLIRNSIPYEKEPDKLRSRKKSKENKENISL